MRQQIALPNFAAFAAEAAPSNASDGSAAGALPPLALPPLAVTPGLPAAPPPNVPAPVPPAAPAQVAPGGGGLDVAQLIGPLFALGAGLGGGPVIGGGALAGANQALQQQAVEADRRRQLAIQQAREDRLLAEEERRRRQQEAEAAARVAAEEAKRQREAAAFVMDTAKQARTFTNKADYDAFLATAEQMGAQAYGLRPGTLRSSAPFVPVPMRDRAQAALDRFWKARKAHQSGTLRVDEQGAVILREPDVDLERIQVQADIDGDGALEMVPYRTVEELAGQATYDNAGQRVLPQPVHVPTYGEAFGVARSTVLADKPLPLTSEGVPDYAKGIGTLRSLSLLRGGTARASTRQEGRQQLKDALYAAMLEPGATDADLARRFSGPFSSLGLNYRAEAARIRRELFGLGRQTIGGELVPPQDPGAIIERGRRVLAGPSTSAPATRTGPPTTAQNDYLKLRAVAQEVMGEEAAKRGVPISAITEDQIERFIAANKQKLLERAAAGGR